jgi:hypothetical protein
VPADPLTAWLLVLGAVFAVNLLPAFGPPTWALLVFFRFNTDVAMVPLVVGGALAAASGRLVLATATRRLRPHLGEHRVRNLATVQEALSGNRRRTAGGLALFLLSPVPSAQLFVGAGLLAVPLLPLTAAFLAGRLVSYSLYVGGAAAAGEGLGDTLTDALSSPVGIALQVVMLAGLVLLVRVDWASVATRHGARPAENHGPRRGPRPDAGA